MHSRSYMISCSVCKPQYNIGDCFSLVFVLSIKDKESNKDAWAPNGIPCLHISWKKKDFLLGYLAYSLARAFLLAHYNVKVLELLVQFWIFDVF